MFSVPASSNSIYGYNYHQVKTNNNLNDDVNQILILNAKVNHNMPSAITGSVTPTIYSNNSYKMIPAPLSLSSSIWSVSPPSPDDNSIKSWADSIPTSPAYSTGSSNSNLLIPSKNNGHGNGNGYNHTNGHHSNQIVSRNRHYNNNNNNNQNNNSWKLPIEIPLCVLDPSDFIIPPSSRFFVIKSYNESDVQSSFIHSVWSSTDLGNKRLNKAFKELHESSYYKFLKSHPELNINLPKILLFFSVNSSGHFCGIAEMTSLVTSNNDLNINNQQQLQSHSPLQNQNSYSNQFINNNLFSSSSQNGYNNSNNNNNTKNLNNIWTDKRWKGLFSINWIFIKDIPNSSLRKLKVINNENKPITNSRDTQEVLFDVGNKVVGIFKGYPGKTSFLQGMI